MVLLLVQATHWQAGRLGHRQADRMLAMVCV